MEIDATHTNALHWYSHLLSWQDKRADAITAAQLAASSDPLSLLMQINVQYILLDARRWDDAFALSDRLLAQGAYPSLQGNTWIGYLRSRQWAKAAQALSAWAGMTGRDAEAATELGELIIAAMEAEEAIELPQELVDRLRIGNEIPELYAAVGDAENTILALQDAVRTGAAYRSLLSMKINPSYDFIRDDPRFVELMTTAGLSD